jgi:VanZ family protein
MRLLGRFAPPIALMGLIFFLSAQPDLNSGLGTIDLIGRKVIHMAEYGVLWVLWARAAGPWPALLITLGYAASDEWHQTFVSGRHGSPVDWAIDATGVAIAAALYARRGELTIRASRARWR